MNIEKKESILEKLFSSDADTLFKQKKNLNILIAFGVHLFFLRFILLIWKGRVLKEDERLLKSH